MVDLAGFTALTEAHGDDQAADLATRFARLAADHLGEGDRLVKSIGDAVLMASHTNQSNQSALTLVTSLLEHCNRPPDPPTARAGLHRGPAVERDGDLFGAAVNLTFASIDPVCRMKVTRNGAAGMLRHDAQEYWFCSLECATTFAQAPDRYARPAG